MDTVGGFFGRNKQKDQRKEYGDGQYLDMDRVEDEQSQDQRSEQSDKKSGFFSMFTGGAKEEPPEPKEEEVTAKGFISSLTNLPKTMIDGVAGIQKNAFNWYEQARMYPYFVITFLAGLFFI